MTVKQVHLSNGKNGKTIVENPNKSEKPAAVDRGAKAAAGDQMYIYKTVDGEKLRLWMRRPAGIKPGDNRPAAVFFHGG